MTFHNSRWMGGSIERPRKNTIIIDLTKPPQLRVLSGEIEIEHFRSLEFHRLVARAGKFLMEGLDQHAAHLVAGCGEMFALPLRLTGVSGSPCRVILRTQAQNHVLCGPPVRY